jgi:glycosyltransferase involved in cell wall biosynthesis
VTCFSYSEKPADAEYEHVKLYYASRMALYRRFETAIGFARLKTNVYDILHFHGDDYLCKGSHRRVRTFYGSALYEAVFAGKPLRFFRQALFYLLEWISCLRKGTCVGISAVTRTALPLVSEIIPCGVPLSEFVADGQRSTEPSVLFLGDLDSRKRGRLLLESFPAVIARQPSAILHVVGPQECTGVQVLYRGRLNRDDLVKEYRSAWVYCCPSSYEGFGVPLVEAMACGAVVVACDNAGVREIINHNYNGLVCDPQSLAETLARALGDSDLRKRLAANGMSFVNRYAIESTAKKYRDLYRRIVVMS